MLDIFEFNAGMIRLMSLFCTVTIIVHLFACLWNYSSLLDYDNPDNWAARSDLQDTDNASRYIACVYFALTGLTTVGYGDITAKTIRKLFK